MSRTTEEWEDRAALLLLLEGIPLQPEAPENLVRAIGEGLLSFNSADLERKHIDQSVKAGRQLMTFIGAVA